MNKIGAIILAAGASSRLGRPKQLLRYHGESLIQRSVRTASHVAEATVAVLGASYQEVRQEIRHLDTHAVFNLDWNKGMGNSLKFGLYELNRYSPGLSGAIIMTCDQPLISPQFLKQMTEAHEEGHAIVAAAYNGIVGIPVLFDRMYFKEILKIDDLRGAKPLLKKYDVFSMPFPEGSLDVDTPEDWEYLLSK